MGLQQERAQLAEMQAHLHKVLKQVTSKIIDINEGQVNRQALLESLAQDEAASAAVLSAVDKDMDVLDIYEGYMKARKEAVAVMGTHEVKILSHIEDLLNAGARSLFEGTRPLLMRQFEVMPDVYCQCALLEDLY